jgi:8-oxo-dGTP pyrophosphatase MutT (NUDIX family)
MEFCCSSMCRARPYQAGFLRALCEALRGLYGQKPFLIPALAILWTSQPHPVRHPFVMTNSRIPDNLAAMVREVSAGGVVLRNVSGEWQVAVIEPRRDFPSPNKKKSKLPSTLLALPKGLVDPGEKPDQTAIREVHEETGVTATLITKLADIKYFYVRSWGDKQRVFKIVSFYLLKYASGSIDDISPDMRIEVQRALWLPLEEAAEKLAYKSEREVAGKAFEYVSAHSEI